MIEICIPAGVLPLEITFSIVSGYNSGLSSLYFSEKFLGCVPLYLFLLLCTCSVIFIPHFIIYYINENRDNKQVRSNSVYIRLFPSYIIKIVDSLFVGCCCFMLYFIVFMKGETLWIQKR